MSFQIESKSTLNHTTIKFDSNRKVLLQITNLASHMGQKRALNMKFHFKLELLLQIVQKSCRHIAQKMRYNFIFLLQIADFLVEIVQ